MRWQALELPTQSRASTGKWPLWTQAGRPFPLLDAYLAAQQPKTGAPGDAFPAGTGDCCAPKLLHAGPRVPTAACSACAGMQLSWSLSFPACVAHKQGLRVRALVEFWYGCAPSSHTPQGVAAAARRAARLETMPVQQITPSRVHGQVYPPCSKCNSILGAMLCTGT
jgi:hypothetical protein